MERKQTMHPSSLGDVFGKLDHPIIKEAYDLEGDLTTEDAFDTHSRPLLDSLEIDLGGLADITGPSNLQRRLRDERGFDKMAFELKIAAGFCRLGYLLMWLPNMRLPHPEFLATTDWTEIVTVECKKRDARDGYEREGANFWKHVQYQLIKEMEKASLNYWIKVTGREFVLADVQPLALEIVSKMRASDHGQFDSVGGRYHVDYLKLVEPGESIPMEYVNMFPRGHFGVNAGTQTADQLRKAPLKGLLSNPKLLRLAVIDDPQHRVKGIIRNLKDAARQVPQGLLNIVFLDVNIADYDQEQAEFNNMVEAVRQELHTRHAQVSAVVLTNMYLSQSLNGVVGWRVRTEFVQHPNPIIIVPARLRFPGDPRGSLWIPGEGVQKA